MIKSYVTLNHDYPFQHATMLARTHAHTQPPISPVRACVSASIVAEMHNNKAKHLQDKLRQLKNSFVYF